MIKKAIFIFFLGFLVLLPYSNLLADQRVDNIEIYLVLDKSLSMVEEIGSVKEYVLNNILNKLVIEGDYFLLIPFYGKTDQSFNAYIKSAQDKNQVSNDITQIQADGRFTDIGNALSTLRKSIISDTDSVRKYMLLITDGKQEAPPDSPFYSPDGSFNHEFLSNTKEIQREGWKIVVLGIGNDTAAKEIARELSAAYVLVPDNTETRDIDTSLNNFLGRHDIISFKDQVKLNKNGQGVLELQIESTGYSDTKEITIIEIKLISETTQNLNILEKPVTIVVEPEKSSVIEIPVSIPLSEQDYTAEIAFIFDGENIFTPAVHTIHIKNESGIPSFYYYIIPVVLLFIIFYYVRRIIKRKKMEEEDNPNGSIKQKI
jgi:von Willebrand factor type A domain